MNPRKSIYSQRWKLISTPAGPITTPVVNDLPTEVLQWHYEWALINEDYEYAQAVAIEAETRNIVLVYPE